jgi:hypothetical protein
MDTLFTFAVSWSAGRDSGRPGTGWATVLGSDSLAGYVEARWTAISMVMRHPGYWMPDDPHAMVTDVELVHVEL